MPKLVVLISGKVGVGKTKLSDGLRQQYDATVVKTKELIKDLALKKLKTDLPSEAHRATELRQATRQGNERRVGT